MKIKIQIVFTKSFWTLLFVLFFSFIVICLNAQNIYYEANNNFHGLGSIQSNYQTDYSSPPVIVFTQGSNPTSIFNSITDTAYTFPTRTFFWDVQESDSLRTIVKIYYAIDDTNIWNELPGNKRSVTLSNLTPGQRQFFVKAENDSGLQSNVICFPDTNDPYCPNIWIVKEPIGDVLLVNDYPQDQNLGQVQTIYENMLINIVGAQGYSVWEIGTTSYPPINPQNSLPYSTIDILATLNYFKKIVWFAHLGNHSISAAGLSLTQYIVNGGNVFMSNGKEAFPDTFWTFTDIDSVWRLNPGGRLLPGIEILASFTNTISDSIYDLEIGQLIGNRVNAIVPGSNSEVIYRMEPDSTASVSVPYQGSPAVGLKYELGLGKSIYFSLPFHYCNGNGNMESVLQYILEEDFVNNKPNIVSLPSNYKLYQNYPNPFNPSTTIKYYLPKSTKVSLKIYDIVGQEISTLVNNFENAGNKSVIWNGRNKEGQVVSTGIYFYRFEAGDVIQNRKMILMK